jgi:hypothetical protein
MDPIRRHLPRLEAGQHVIDGGLDYLVESWNRIACQVEAGDEVWMSEEWLNDLDTRELLHDLLENVPEAQRAAPEIEAADVRFRGAAVPVTALVTFPHTGPTQGMTGV